MAWREVIDMLAPWSFLALALGLAPPEAAAAAPVPSTASRPLASGLRVRVLRPDGTPWPGAKIYLRKPFEPLPSDLELLGGAEVVLPARGPDYLTLQVSAPGAAGLRRRVFFDGGMLDLEVRPVIGGLPVMAPAGGDRDGTWAALQEIEAAVQAERSKCDPPTVMSHRLMRSPNVSRPRDCADPRASVRAHTDDPRPAVRLAALVSYFTWSSSEGVFAATGSPRDRERALRLLAAIPSRAPVWQDVPEALWHAVHEVRGVEAQAYLEDAKQMGPIMEGLVLYMQANAALVSGQSERAGELIEKLAVPRVARTAGGMFALTLHGGRSLATRLPDFSLPVLYGPIPSLSSTDLRDQVTVLQFWTTWCKPCLVEMKHLEEIAPRFAGQRVQFVSISADEHANPIHDLFASTPAPPWPVIYVPSNERETLLRAFGVSSYPTLLFSDGRGGLRHVGGQPDRETIERTITGMLAELPPPRRKPRRARARPG